MTLVKSIGKNTLGDNNKMSVRLHEYNMSTHDISTVFRSTIGVGTLVPFVKILCQKGDIIDMQMINKTLTQPTLGPLFGSFKLQHFAFFAGFRLYNSWLHNNRAGIGMKMSDIKLPQMNASTNEKGLTEISNSSLYKYLGWTGSRRTGKKGGVLKNGTPLLIYQDIFKNYFANLQEENFYIIGKQTIPTDIEVTNAIGGIGNPKEDNGKYIIQIGTQQGITGLSKTVTLKALNGNISNWSTFWGKVTVLYAEDFSQNPKTVKISTLTSDTSTQTITLDKISNPAWGIKNFNYQYDSTEPTINLVQTKLEVLDQLRDVILHKKGNETLVLNDTGVGTEQGGSEELVTYIKSIIESQSSKQGGLLVKTYDSDIFNNFIKTDWIEGSGSIAEKTSIDITANDGKLSLDALNLQEKVYNLLNRIAVSGGTYRDWLDTVYTAGKYMDRPETPVFIGGMTQYIEFDEVVSKSASNTEYGDQPLGDIAAIGRSGKPTNSGHIHYQCEEPGYILGVMAITPMVDYSQGNDFDLNFASLDDLHKPALDGIGYQDLIQEQMVGTTAEYVNSGGLSAMKQKAFNKTVAWIDYMTNYNRTYGEFAVGGNLDFMVLNRRYETTSDEATINDLTTYIDPTKYIEIFADTDITSQNFWVQTAMNITRRGNYSAKQIPFL